MTHLLRTLIEAADRAITERDYDRLMDFYADDATLVVKPGMLVRGKAEIRAAFVAITAHFGGRLSVRQGEMVVIQGADTALVVMETILDIAGEDETIETIIRKATYVFTTAEGRWLCTVDNSYGVDLLD